jgi:hypothetical protein
MPDKRSMKARVRAYPEIKASLDAFYGGRTQLVNVLDANREPLDVAGTIRRLEHELIYATDPQAAAPISQKLCEYRTNGPQLEQGAQIKASIVVHELMLPAIRSALTNAIQIAQEERDRDQADEQTFFANFGMPAESTGVTKRWDRYIESLKGALDAFDTPGTVTALRAPNAGALAGPVSWFED